MRIILRIIFPHHTFNLVRNNSNKRATTTNLSSSWLSSLQRSFSIIGCHKPVIHYKPQSTSTQTTNPSASLIGPLETVFSPLCVEDVVCVFASWLRATAAAAVAPLRALWESVILFSGDWDRPATCHTCSLCQCVTEQSCIQWEDNTSVFFLTITLHDVMHF